MSHPVIEASEILKRYRLGSIGVPCAVQFGVTLSDASAAGKIDTFRVAVIPETRFDSEQLES